MVPVTARTNIESPKIWSAGVESGANILVEVEPGAAKQFAASSPAPASPDRPRNFKLEQPAILMIRLQCSQHRTLFWTFRGLSRLGWNRNMPPLSAHAYRTTLAGATF